MLLSYFVSYWKKATTTTKKNKSDFPGRQWLHSQHPTLKATFSYFIKSLSFQIRIYFFLDMLKPSLSPPPPSTVAFTYGKCCKSGMTWQGSFLTPRGSLLGLRLKMRGSGLTCEIVYKQCYREASTWIFSLYKMKYHSD